MGRIFSIQSKNLDTFRRKHRRKLRKGDVIRIYGATNDTKVREELDLRPKTKDVLFTKKYTNVLTQQSPTVRVLEIGKRP